MVCFGGRVGANTGIDGAGAATVIGLWGFVDVYSIEGGFDGTEWFELPQLKISDRALRVLLFDFAVALSTAFD